MARHWQCKKHGDGEWTDSMGTVCTTECPVCKLAVRNWELAEAREEIARLTVLAGPHMCEHFAEAEKLRAEVDRLKDINGPLATLELIKKQQSTPRKDWARAALGRAARDPHLFSYHWRSSSRQAKKATLRAVARELGLIP